MSVIPTKGSTKSKKREEVNNNHQIPHPYIPPIICNFNSLRFTNYRLLLSQASYTIYLHTQAHTLSLHPCCQYTLPAHSRGRLARHGHNISMESRIEHARQHIQAGPILPAMPNPVMRVGILTILHLPHAHPVCIMLHAPKHLCTANNSANTYLSVLYC